MQWMWIQQGQFLRPGIGGLYPGLTGYSKFSFDPELASRTPGWQSEWFPESGAVLRAHFPSDRETYMHYIQGRLHEHYDYDEGSFILWGKGKPLCEDFGYYGRAPAHDHNCIDYGKNEELSGNQETIDFVTGESADYLHGRLGGWHRQILLVKDKDLLGPTYFVLNDTLTNNRPAHWRVWLASGTAPSTNSAVPIRVQGRYDVDLVVWFAQTYSGKLTTEELKRNNGASGFNTRDTIQRSLDLELPPNATVTAILYPVLHDQPTPKFTRLDACLVRIDSAFGTDYSWIGLERNEYRAQGLAINSRCGAIQIRPDGAHITLSGAGQVIFEGRRIDNVDQKKSRTAVIPVSAERKEP
jgi:hypothetical protein